jgi:acyl dehydratase
MLSREHIGMRLPAVSARAEIGQMKLFCKATGQTNPVFLDERAAKDAGYRGLVAPPTFAVCLYFLGSPEPFVAFRTLWGGIERMLHADQKFEFFDQVIAEDTITFESEITDIFLRKNQTLEFITQTITGSNQLGNRISRQHMTVALQIG